MFSGKKARKQREALASALARLQEHLGELNHFAVSEGRLRKMLHRAEQDGSNRGRELERLIAPGGCGAHENYTALGSASARGSCGCELILEMRGLSEPSAK